MTQDSICIPNDVVCPECHEKFGNVKAFCPNCGCPITLIKGIPFRGHPNNRAIRSLFPGICKNNLPIRTCENPYELVNCSECGLPISVMAEFCVHCGIPRAQIKQDDIHDDMPYTRIKRKIEYDNGDFYEGEILDDKRDGHGIYTWVDGVKYIGNFVNNKRHGPGKYIDRFGRLTLQEWDSDILIKSESE